MTNEIPAVDPSGPVGRGRPRRGPERSGPPTNVLAIVLAALAVVAGFLILRSLSDNGEIVPGATATPATETTLAPVVTESTAPATTTTTAPPAVFEGAIVVVANANGIDGSAGSMSRSLEAAGFTVADATNASAEVGVIEETLIYYDASAPGALPVAETVARVLGGDVSIAPLPEVAPTVDGSVRGEVLVLLGNDKANKTLEELAAAAEAAAAGAVPSPEVAGTDTSDPDG